MSAIYLVGLAGALSGPITLLMVPGIGYQMPAEAIELSQELPEPESGFAWAWVDGAPLLRVDHRGTVYSTVTGEAQEHAELGELPEGLTEEPWPGGFHIWRDGDWVLDEQALLQAALQTERVWRNGRISATDFLVLPDYPISTAQRAELYAYRQALRDWPAAGQFPSQEARPVPPDWIAELPQ